MSNLPLCLLEIREHRVAHTGFVFAFADVAGVEVIPDVLFAAELVARLLAAPLVRALLAEELVARLLLAPDELDDLAKAVGATSASEAIATTNIRKNFMVFSPLL